MAVAAVAAVAPSAWADPAVTTTVPVHFVTSSECPADTGGEAIAFDGSMQLTYSYGASPKGFREQFHAEVHLVGVGLTTGDRYVSVGSDLLSAIYAGSGEAVITEISHVEHIHTGEQVAGDDFSLRMVLSPGGFTVEREGCS